MSPKRYFFTSESVTEGHPDKLCDRISDSILDSIIAKDPPARVAVETAVTNGLVLVAGEITTGTYVEIPKLVRETIAEVGYTRAKYGFDAETCGVIVAIQGQSKDIAMGVDKSFEVKEGGEIVHEDLEHLGAGDQGLMFGFATDETPELMPLPISIAHRLARRLADVRKDGTLPYLRPDGKSQVTVEYEENEPIRLENVVIAAQHAPDIDRKQLEEDIQKFVIDPILPKKLINGSLRIFINPTGRFVVGGPQGDTGLTGRKIIIDTYGGSAPHGGGAFSG